MSNLSCPRCGSSINFTTMTCQYCGHSLDVSWKEVAKKLAEYVVLTEECCEMAPWKFNQRYEYTEDDWIEHVIKELL
jgi:hypothetical protein